MFDEVEPDPQERLAARVADVVGSLWFPAAIAVAIVIWVVVNVVFRPFEPYPMIMIGGLGMVVSTIGAFYGPLILLAQRQAANRDRARDIETYRVAANSERDLHLIQQRLAAIEPGGEPGRAPGGDPDPDD